MSSQVFFPRIFYENDDDEFSGQSSGDDQSVVSDCESVVNTRNSTVKKTSVNGLVKLDEGDKLHRIVASNFFAKLGENRMKAQVEGVYRNMFNQSVVSQAKVSCFQIYANAIGAKNKAKNEGEMMNVKYGWFGGYSKDEIHRIVQYGFSCKDIGKCTGFGNVVMLNADHSPLESVESATVDGDGLKHVLLCRVLLGKTEVVNRFSTQCHPSSEEFDSGVDDEVPPKKYIIWSSKMNTHILPEFVISFKTVNGVHLGKPVSPWIPIRDLIANLSKMLPPKSVKEIT